MSGHPMPAAYLPGTHLNIGLYRVTLRYRERTSVAAWGIDAAEITAAVRCCALVDVHTFVPIGSKLVAGVAAAIKTSDH